MNIQSLICLTYICLITGFSASIQIGFFINLKNTVFFWRNSLLFASLIFFANWNSSSLFIFFYCLFAGIIVNIICYTSYEEKKFHKLYSTAIQLIVSIASIWLSIQITAHLTLSKTYADLSIAGFATLFNLIWCASMYYGKIRVFTILPEPEENYQKTFSLSLLFLIALILYISGGNDLLIRIFGQSLIQDFLILLLIAMLLLNILSLCIRSNDQLIHEERINAITSQENIMKQYADKLLEHNQEIRRLEHDQNHLLTTLITLLDYGKFQEIHTILTELTCHRQTICRTIYCENASINAILTDTVQHCQTLDIQLILNIHLESMIQIKTIDLIVLLKNALDNAISACEKIEEKTNRTIVLTLLTAGGFLSLKCVNSIASPVSIKANHIASTKQKDGRLHGIGIESMRTVTEKYNGKFKITASEKEFTVIAILECV